jgi:large subunit ribosomal protein L23
MEAKDIILKPLITEKASGQIGGQNRYSFKVNRLANKNQIKRAIGEIFGVKVKSVKTVIIKGKTRKTVRRGKKIFLPAWKKALIELKEGEKIALFETETK